MSAMKRLKEERRDKATRRRKRKVKEVSWRDIDDATIRRLIDLTEHYNGAVRFGRSRDCSVFSIGFYIGEDRFTEWIPGSDDPHVEIDRLISEIAEDYEFDSSDD